MKKIIYGLIVTSLTLIVFIFLMRSWLRISILPKPTGPFAIGTTIYHFVDKDRKDYHVQHQEINRELMIQIWYPAQKNNKSTYRYIHPQSSATIKEDLHKHFQIRMQQLAILDHVQTHAMVNSMVSSKYAPYPIIIFSPGSGAPVNFYTSLLEELASHGYIIVAISYPYITSSIIDIKGNVIPAMTFKMLQDIWKYNSEDEVMAKEQEIWLEDIAFVIQELHKINNNDPHHLLTHKLDLERVGLFGHSFGGGASVNACRALKDCKAVINIDGRSYGSNAQKGFDIPIMFIRNSFHKEEKERPVRELWDGMTGPAYYIVIKDALHGSFTDLFLFIPWKGEPPLNLDSRRGIAITRALLVDFFDVYLKKKDSTLATIEKFYPEINIKKNRILHSILN